MYRRLGFVAACAAVLSCNGTTGNKLISFPAYARGTPGASAPFVAGGYSIQLTRATMLIGAVYVDESPLGNVAGGPECIVPDVFAAQVPGGVRVDLLSDEPQEFSVYGQGTLDTGHSWQLWLTDGNINEVNHAHIVELQGVATRISDGVPVTFASVVTINTNRLVPVADPAQPGANPICKRRIVLVGGLDTTFFDGGSMTVTVDPRAWFSFDFDFASLPQSDSDTCLSGDSTVPISVAADYGDAAVCIPNTNFASGAGATEGAELFRAISGGGAAYSFQFR